MLGEWWGKQRTGDALANKPFGLSREQFFTFEDFCLQGSSEYVC